MMKALQKKRKGGFTLIELIVVIAILGILAAIAIPRLSGARNNAAINADAGSVRTIQSAISLAEADGTINLAATAAPTVADITAAIIPKYLAAVPKAQTGIGWTITVGGAANAWTVGVAVTPTGGTVSTGWANP